ncbi:DUF1673 family protein [Methanoculleus sp. Afa-1]|uniref:DUF1673 family protein n=1 Tax=Methanoculleus formosensis TaxID=2590886 RepID=A0A9E4ZIN9_9EURY|nr:DUF1673 domain-containing protein [Methanoculleus sp. Afa-1]MCT8337853.1 DUF1673 family protein [Methanoculleus sp. Afa-1]
MMLKFAEAIRRWMGWCPNATGTVRRRYVAPDGEIGMGAVADGKREAVEGVFVDYTSPRFLPALILVVGVFFVLLVVGFLIPSLRPGFYVFTGLFFMAYAVVRLYLDKKKAEIESFGDSVVVRRSRTRPLVFRKDAVRSVEVKQPYLPIPRWVSALLLVLMYAGVFYGMVWIGAMRYPGSPADPDFIFHAFYLVGFMVYMLELLCRSLVSLRYPGHVRVKLEPAGFLHIYTDDPERIARVLEVS